MGSYWTGWIRQHALVIAVVGAAFGASFGIAPTKAHALRTHGGMYELEVLIDGRIAPILRHHGESYLQGRVGARYVLRVWNRSERRVEAVVTVDGLDVLDGKPGDYRNKRGYVIDPYNYVDIDGWRLSQSRVAAFRFASVPDSYASLKGDDRNVGVIGVAVFPERPRVAYRHRPLRRVAPQHYDRHERSRRAPAREGRSYESSRPAPAEAPSVQGDRAPSSGAVEGYADDAEVGEDRPGLGTEFGEALASQVYDVRFVRAHAHRPAAILGLRYNDRDGLIAMGVPLSRPHRPSDAWLRRTANPFVGSGYAEPPRGWRSW